MEMSQGRVNKELTFRLNDHAGALLKYLRKQQTIKNICPASRSSHQEKHHHRKTNPQYLHIQLGAL